MVLQAAIQWIDASRGILYCTVIYIYKGLIWRDLLSLAGMYEPQQK